MGYSTDFYGQIKFDKRLDEELRNYINEFSMTRRMKRDVDIIKQVDPDWERHLRGLSLHQFLLHFPRCSRN